MIRSTVLLQPWTFQARCGDAFRIAEDVPSEDHRQRPPRSLNDDMAGIQLTRLAQGYS